MGHRQEDSLVATRLQEGAWGGHPKRASGVYAVGRHGETLKDAD